ncbi:MAG: hypothetical protein SVY53_04125 [Chloroflexota bacterium]|nr:hypothetical protein [Chloroflexota bacterium]
MNKALGLWSPTDCQLFTSCRAPLCPLDPCVINGVWYTSEPICRVEQFQDLPWIGRQRDIKKLVGRNSDTFFTLKMLDRVRTVHPGLRGADPGISNGEGQWIEQRQIRNSSKRKGLKLVEKKKTSKSAETVIIAIEYDGNTTKLMQKISGALEDDTALKRVTFFRERSFTQPVRKQTELKIKVADGVERKPLIKAESVKDAKKAQSSTRKKTTK